MLWHRSGDCSPRLVLPNPEKFRFHQSLRVADSVIAHPSQSHYLPVPLQRRVWWRLYPVDTRLPPSRSLNGKRRSRRPRSRRRQLQRRRPRNPRRRSPRSQRREWPRNPPSSPNPKSSRFQRSMESADTPSSCKVLWPRQLDPVLTNDFLVLQPNGRLSPMLRRRYIPFPLFYLSQFLPSISRWMLIIDLEISRPRRKCRS